METNVRTTLACIWVLGLMDCGEPNLITRFPASERVESEYSGGQVSGKPHGRGTMKIFAPDGQLYSVYEGEWVAGEFSGHGVHKRYEEGRLQTRTEGEFKAFLPSGSVARYDDKGRLLWQGECSNGELNGAGVEYGYDPVDGSLFEEYRGLFRKGLRSGQGQWTVFFRDGRTQFQFEGEFSAGAASSGKTRYFDGDLVACEVTAVPRMDFRCPSLVGPK